MEKRLTMLVVDNVEVNRASLRSAFIDVYEIVEAEDGLAAMQMLHEKQIDIVILDLFMPNLDGAGVLKKMKADPKLRNIPVVVKTAVDEETEVEMLEAGADDFIFSPCDPTLLQKRVKNIVHKYTLEHELLQKQVEEARHTSKIREAFMIDMSHELRNPINGILEITELSREIEKDPVKVREAFDKIAMHGEYLLSLLNDILDISMIDKEEITFRDKLFGLSNVVAVISEQFFTQCKKKDISFSFEVADIVHEYLIGDEVRIKQIWINLLSNALKYTEPGGSIKTGFSQQIIDDKKVLLEISVEDSGCGIAEASMEKIWRFFERDETAGATNEGGFGLGLPITRSIVEMMGGSISAESEEGKGSRFLVKIPLKFGTPPAQQHKNFQTMKALIVGDEEIACEYYKAILNRLGIHFDVSWSAKETLNLLKLAYLRGEGYDLCFVNWNIQGDSGAALVHSIRKIFDRDTLVIISPSYASDLMESEMKKAGVDYILRKPVFQSTIYNLMIEVCKKPFSEKMQDEPSYDFMGKHVLVVEDNAINAEVLLGCLEHVNLSCDWVKNGKVAVEAYTKMGGDYYSGIFMDITMPVMDGYAAAREIREIEKKSGEKSVPIIAVTANTFAADIIKVYQSGMNAHITKPFNAAALYHIAEEFLSD